MSSPTPVSTVVATPAYTVTVGLPDECYGILPDGEGSAGTFQPCTGFRFSPDERYLGFYFGPDRCGRGIMILDTQTAAIVYSLPFGGHGFEFLTNGKIWFSAGHCEGSWLSLLDPITGDARQLGPLSVSPEDAIWNPARTAIAFSSTYFGRLGAVVWGYNVERDFVFLPPPERWYDTQYDNHFLWTPDGSAILHQHRVLSYTSASDTYTFSGALQIISVDATTGERRVLASDPRYDYHLCAGGRSWCDHWDGDWIQVSRFPFEPLDVPRPDGRFDVPEWTCLAYGIDCDEAPELFALNWRTGEIVPWHENQLPTPGPAR